MNKLVTVGLLSLLFLLAGPVLVELVRKDSGYILISVGNTTIETSFWLLALPLAVIVARAIYKGLLRILYSLGFSARIFSGHRSKQIIKKTHRGLLHFVEENWAVAKKDLEAVAKQSDQPFIFLLAAAESARKLGDFEACEHLLSEAEIKAPYNQMSVWVARAKLQLAQKNYDACLETLQLALAQDAKNIAVLQLLKHVYCETKQWQALVTLLPTIKASEKATKQFNEAQHVMLEERVYTALFEETTLKGGDKAPTDFWKSLPKTLQHSPSIIERYSIMLQREALTDKAEIVVRQALNKHWSPELVAHYGLLASSKPAEQLSQIEKWLLNHGNDAALLLAAARLAMRNQLWGKARGYFEQSIALTPCPAAYAELAALIAQLGDHQLSTSLYQKGLLLST